MSEVISARRWLDYRGTLIPEIRGGQDDALSAEELALVGDEEGKKGADGSWASAIEDEGLKTELAKFESQEKFFEAMGFEVTGDEGDWRADLPDNLKETAKKFSSVDEAIIAVESMRKRDSQVRVPGKDATDDERTAFHKAVGVPATAKGYAFPAMPEGHELTDEIKSSRDEWADRFHKLSVPKETAMLLSQALNDDLVGLQAAEIKADSDFAQSQETALRAEWKGDQYDVNKKLANNAFAEIAKRAGLDLDELGRIETKEGRFLFDHVPMLKLFAVVGREMSEGALGPTLSEAEIETLDEQIKELRTKSDEASKAGDSKLANKYYEQEQALLEKQKGKGAIVGSEGRTA